LLKIRLLRVLIISLIFVLFFLVGSSLSVQKMTSGPMLPKGYKDWPHKFEKSKKVNDKNSLVLNIYANENKDVLWIWSVNGRVVQSVFLEGGFNGHKPENKRREQYWLGNLGGYVSYEINLGFAKDPIKFATEEELYVTRSVFRGNIKNRFEFDFDEQVKEFDFELELKRFLDKIRLSG